MKKYAEFLEEVASAPPKPSGPSTSEQAKQLGLQYVGFGRYEDPKTRQVTYIVQNGRLVPFDKAVKTNTYAQANGDDFGQLSKQLRPVVQQDMEQLMKTYKPEKYSNEELEAIKLYTDANHDAVNTVLNSLPTGIPAKQIQPLTPTDNTPELVDALDTALARAKTPKDLTLYATLSSAISPKDFGPKTKLNFKGFRSTTINLETAIQQLDPSAGGGTILQINLKQGSHGMLVDDFSSTPGQGEFILPRGTKLTVQAGPNKMTGTYQSVDNTLDLYFYNCVAETK